MSKPVIIAMQGHGLTLDYRVERKGQAWHAHLVNKDGQIIGMPLTASTRKALGRKIDRELARIANN